MPDILDVMTAIFRSTNGIRVGLNPVFPPLSFIERKLLDDLRPHIDEKHVSTFDEHVAAINFAQRQSGNRLTVLFSWKFPGNYNWNRNLYFEPREGTKKLLNFKLVFPDSKEIHGNLVSIDGVLSNISFGEDLSLYKKYKAFEVFAKSGAIKRT